MDECIYKERLKTHPKHIYTSQPIRLPTPESNTLFNAYPKDGIGSRYVERKEKKGFPRTLSKDTPSQPSSCGTLTDGATPKYGYGWLLNLTRLMWLVDPEGKCGLWLESVGRRILQPKWREASIPVKKYVVKTPRHHKIDRELSAGRSSSFGQTPDLDNLVDVCGRILHLSQDQVNDAKWYNLDSYHVRVVFIQLGDREEEERWGNGDTPEEKSENEDWEQTHGKKK
ncbi:hypothetical protein K435DRAFT_845749 [Dendrothele bispora CBS 962.96]|uniref:Uncharacterized protein n=1 Tax=Dendrothele bispora (strain CBS 962.96) TaxID=1314807 RepID=A0A4S8KS12_DENBC|nr:hypothetical protein K435DRAFT_845749 [Dendrothele bispora CBS 962.96]